ncbi:MAG: ATP-grasp domain-containing protein [Candidatus Thorarchaeota archaeon]
MDSFHCLYFQEIHKAEALIRSADDADIMTQRSSILKGKNVGVIGFNARPIAASLKRRGAFTYVSDYWGDTDLKDVSTDCIAVLSPIPGIRHRQPLDQPLYQSLVDNLSILTKSVELDYIIIGSGFDDHADSLKQIHEQGLLIGSSPTQMKNARDHDDVSSLVPSKLCCIPPQVNYFSINELVEGITGREFPYLIRPIHSGGGSGIRFMRNENDLKRFLIAKQEEETEPTFVVQKYIQGRDYSCSVLSSGTEAKAISVQGQLIGSPVAGRNCDFAYCGNFFPSGLDSTVEQKITKVSEHLSKTLGLKGSIGFDFVVDDTGKVWLLEINPRIQGTLEMLEIAGDISITEQHVRASSGELLAKHPTFNPAVKMIVYSRKAGTVPDLSKYQDVYDRSPKGTRVERRDPICTVVKSGGNILDCYQQVSETAIGIQNQVRP